MTESIRYHRQEQLSEIGPEGQQRLGGSTVLIVGCGGLGCAVADLLARAGVGTLRIADADRVQIDNLHRQTLFAERDAYNGELKVEAAERRLRAINSEVCVEPKRCAFGLKNAKELLAEVDLVIDATDDVLARYVINDACRQAKTPWIYGGALGTAGMAMPILPAGPCLRCVFAEPAPTQLSRSNEERGVLGPLVTMIAALQSSLAIKLLVGHEVDPELFTVDTWELDVRKTAVCTSEDCPECGRITADEPELDEVG